MASLTDFLSWIDPANDNATRINGSTPMDNTLTGRVNEAQRRANVNRVDLATGDLTGRRTGTAAVGLSDQLEAYKDFKEEIETIKKETGGGRGVRALERASEREKNTLTRLGKNVYKDINEGIARHNTVIDAIDKQEKDILARVDRDFANKRLTIQNRIASATTPGARTIALEDLNRLKNNHEAVRERISHQFEEIGRPHRETLSEFERIAGEIEEHTGLKRSEYLKTKPALVESGSGALAKTEESLKGLATKDGVALETVAGKNITKEAHDMGVVGKEAGIWDRVKANFKISKLDTNAEGAVTAVERTGAGKLAMAGGIAASIGAIALGIKGLVSGKTDENGQSVPSDSGDTLKNAGLIVAGGAGVALLALGKGKATGAIAH